MYTISKNTGKVVKIRYASEAENRKYVGLFRTFQTAYAFSIAMKGVQKWN